MDRPPFLMTLNKAVWVIAFGLSEDISTAGGTTAILNNERSTENEDCQKVNEHVHTSIVNNFHCTCNKRERRS